MTTLVVVLPFSAMAYLAFTDFSFSIPDRDGSFIGLENFHRTLSDSRLINSLSRTVAFSFCAVTLELAFGLVIAVVIPLKSQISRALIPFMAAPVLLSGVTAGLLWRYLLQGDYGLIPFLLRSAGLLSGGSLMGTPELAFAAILAADVWQWTPFCAIVLLACRAAIPEGPMLAAKLDGATAWQVLRDVTVPGLRPGLLVCFLFRLTECIREFDKIVIMSNGGPGDSTELISLYLWNVSFVHGDLGYGSAVTLLLYVTVLLGANLFLARAQPRED